MPPWLSTLLPILGLLVAVAIVLARLPKVDMGHSPAFKRRRIQNWLPLGLTYAFLYFGRYNLSAIIDLLERQNLLTKEQFGVIDGWGAAVYGIAFLLNGPLTDRWGGRATILIAAAGSALMNVGMALVMHASIGGGLDGAGRYELLLALNAANMYFQSFGAVSIVKVNAAWFHVRERGVLGGLFGVLISLGLYFAYDWSLAIAQGFGIVPVFAVPAAVLVVFFVFGWFLIRDRPGTAGHTDFDTGDASSGQSASLALGQIALRMLSNRVILILIAVEFCSGFLRQGVMKWFRSFAASVGQRESFVYQNWGMLLCVAGILGGVMAGTISDHVFHSRRGPVAAVLYGGLLLGSILVALTLGSPALAWSAVFMSMCVIGVHGMLSGTASADFGGSKNAGLVTGIIDGFVYLGTATQAFLYARILPRGDSAKDPGNWIPWPGAMIPIALIGLLLCLLVWNARPRPDSSPASGRVS